MAEEALLKLGQHLSCSVCHQLYTTPKLLHCHHVYCLGCLEGQVPKNRLNVICQECNQATPIPPKGLAKLPTALYVSRLLDIQKTFEPIICQPVENCCLHNRKLEFYCKDCKVLICTHCALRGGDHRKHEYTEVSQEIFDECVKEFSKSLGSLKGHSSSVGTALRTLEARSDQLSAQCEALETGIRSSLSKLHDILYDREASLLHQLGTLKQGKADCIAKQKARVECLQSQLSSCLAVLEAGLASGMNGRILKEEKTIKNQLGDLIKAFQPDTLTPDVEVDVAFAISSLCAACNNIGQLSSLSEPDPTRCRLTGKGIQPLVVGDMSFVHLQVVDYGGNLFEGDVRSIECKLVREDSGTSTRGTVERKGPSQYRIGYLAEDQGSHQLHITIEGQRISGSPFTVGSGLSSRPHQSSSLAGQMTTCFLP